MNRELRRSKLMASSLAAGQRRKAITMMLAGALLLTPMATLPPAPSPALAQEAASQPSDQGQIQVIAQGIARIPRGEIAWTIRRLDLSGNEATPVEAFPLGFVLADDASVVVLDDAEEVLGILDDGEAVFLSGGDSGGLAPWRDPEASLYEVALVPAEAAAGAAAGNVVGAPFATPEGRAFELELGRGVLGNGEEAVVPASRSGTPTLFLQTDGTSQLATADGEPVELAAGQFALLVGDVTVRGVGEGPAAFVVAAIGEAAPTQAADGATTGRANRANRGNRASAGTGGGGGGGAAEDRQARRAANQAENQAAPPTEAGAEDDRAARRAAREATRAAREAENAASGTPQPGAATPSPVATEEPTTPATPSPVVEQDETGTDDTNTVDQDFTEGEETEETVVPEPTVPVVETPIVETPIVETPIVETPVVETPIVETPVTEAPVVETPAGETTEPVVPPADEVPGSEEIVEGDVPPAETAPEATLPVEQVPAAAAPPVEEVPVEAAPVQEAPAAPVEEQPATDPATGG